MSVMDPDGLFPDSFPLMYYLMKWTIHLSLTVAKTQVMTKTKIKMKTSKQRHLIKLLSFDVNSF